MSALYGDCVNILRRSHGRRATARGPARRVPITSRTTERLPPAMSRSGCRKNVAHYRTAATGHVSGGGGPGYPAGGGLADGDDRAVGVLHRDPDAEAAARSGVDRAGEE